MLDIVGCCWVMLEWFDHPTQQNHVRASAMLKACIVLNSFSWVEGSYGCDLRFAKGENRISNASHYNAIKWPPFISPISLFSGFAPPIFYFTILFAITRNFNQFILSSFNSNIERDLSLQLIKLKHKILNLEPCSPRFLQSTRRVSVW